MAEFRGLSHLLLQVGDLARAERFYVDVLGFQVKERSTFGDGRPLLVLKEGLGLTEMSDEGKAQRQKVGQALEHVAFKVADVAGLARELLAAKIQITDGPKQTNYGTALYFLDPDGVRIECHD